MKYSRGFTLIELLVTMTIVVLMAVITIPSFGKHQRAIELQNKADEVKAGLDGMQLKALNPEQGITRYYAQITEGVSGSIEYGSCTSSNCSAYKTVNLTSDQTLATNVSAYLVCDKGKSYCCNKANATTDACLNTEAMAEDFFTITNGTKTTEFKIFANPFRVQL